MKTLKFLTLALAAVALLFTSCDKPKDIDATGISLDQVTAELSNAGPSVVELTATLTPADATSEITWGTSDPAIATVLALGTNKAIVTATGAGVATITATANGFTAECEVTVTWEALYPELPAPGAGKVTIAIYAEGACNGLYLAGVTGAYPGTTEGSMTAVPDWNNWYQITANLADFVGFNMKGMLLPNGGAAPTYDYEWTAGSIEILAGAATMVDDYGTANALSVSADADNSVIYLTVGSFKASPCIANSTYNVSVKVPEMCEAAGDQVYIIGGFEGSSWGTALPMTKDGDYWKATISGQVNTEFKFRGSESSWDIEVQSLKEDETWGGMNNLSLTADLNPVFDLSNAAAYRWNVCAPAKK